MVEIVTTTVLSEFEWTRPREQRLVCFLLEHYADKPNLQLAEILEWLDILQDREILGETIAEGIEIRTDIAQVIERKGAKTTVSDVAQPVVLFISGGGRAGKTTLGMLLSRRDLPIFSLDRFVQLCGSELCLDAVIHEQARKSGRGAVDTFWTTTPDAIALLFSAEYGFKPCAPLSIIDGYLPTTLRGELVSALKKRGYRVWVVGTE
jgi:hypothetical protein